MRGQSSSMGVVKSFKFKADELGVFKDVGASVAQVEKGRRIVGLTDGSYSLIDLIHGVLKKTGAAHLITCTWSAGIKDIAQIKWMLDSQLIQSIRVITDAGYKNRQITYAMSLEDWIGEENVRVSIIHAKFVLVHNQDWKIVINTSMNLNANRKIESFEITENAEYLGFYMKYVEHTFGEMPGGVFTDYRTTAKVVDHFFTENQKQDERNWWEL